MIFAYAAMFAWLIGAGAYIATEMAEQHAIFAELRVIRAGEPGWEKAGDLLLKRGNLGLLYVLQEMQQDPDSDHYYRAGRAYEEAGGRYRAPLDPSEKAAVRKLITDSRAKLMDYLEGRKVDIPPDALAFAGKYISVLNEIDVPRVDKQPAIGILQKVAAGTQAGTPEEVSYLRTNFEKLVEHVDHVVTGDTIDVTPAERDLFLSVAQYCLAAKVKEDAVKNMIFAAQGLQKMSGKVCPGMSEEYQKKMAKLVAVQPTRKEASALRALLKNSGYTYAWVGKLDSWMRGQKVEFTDPETRQFLMRAPECFARYEASRARLSGLVVRYVQQMKTEKSRFVLYPVLDDKAKRAEAGVFELISSLWKKTDDRVMVLDMINICATTNDQVRHDIEAALRIIGEPAIPSLIKSIGRDKIDQALAAKTSLRTKAERLRELNASNKIVRLSCIKTLGDIGGSSAPKVFVPLIDDKDPDISASAKTAMDALSQQR